VTPLNKGSSQLDEFVRAHALHGAYTRSRYINLFNLFNLFNSFNLSNSRAG